MNFEIAEHYTSIEDTISEMECWSCFQDKKRKELNSNPFGTRDLKSISSENSNINQKEISGEDAKTSTSKKSLEEKIIK